MKSRYDYMKPSMYKDIDGDYFPDPSTLNYNNIEAEKISTIELTELTCEKFWALLPSIYASYEYDDILLSVNRIPHRNFLKPGDIIFAPSKADIEKSLK